MDPSLSVRVGQEGAVSVALDPVALVFLRADALTVALPLHLALELAPVSWTGPCDVLAVSLDTHTVFFVLF